MTLSRLNAKTIDAAYTMNTYCPKCGARPGNCCKDFRHGYGIVSGPWTSTYKSKLPVGTFHGVRARAARAELLIVGEDKQ
jgi:hypothetical protein